MVHVVFFLRRFRPTKGLSGKNRQKRISQNCHISLMLNGFKKMGLTMLNQSQNLPTPIKLLLAAVSSAWGKFKSGSCIQQLPVKLSSINLPSFFLKTFILWACTTFNYMLRKSTSFGLFSTCYLIISLTVPVC